MKPTPYNEGFFDGLLDQGRASAREIAGWVCDLARPESVLDVGCAEGVWAAEFQSRGVPTVLGVDGDYVDRTRLLIPQESFRPADLNASFQLDQRFDLVVCLEVAEHLDESSADRIVEGIASHTDAVLFSAAIPLQGGTDHRNEQWPGYWTDRFAKFEFKAFDVVRPRFWDDQSVAPWYRQNTMIYTRGEGGFAKTLCDAIAGLPSFHGAPLVHPESWARHHATSEYCVGRFAGPVARLAGLPSSVLRALTRRFGT